MDIDPLLWSGAVATVFSLSKAEAASRIRTPLAEFAVWAAMLLVLALF